jgi:hypothetical protein
MVYDLAKKGGRRSIISSGQVRRYNTRHFREDWYAWCNYEPNREMEGYYPGVFRICPMSEPEVIESSSAAKQDTSGKTLIQLFFY